MKSLALATGMALLGSQAFAQVTAPAPAAPSVGTMPLPASSPTTGEMGSAPEGAGASNMGLDSPIVILPQPQAGAAAQHYLASDVANADVFGTDNAKIGEVEDFVLNADGTIAAVVVEVGGFLGVGEKDVLVRWSALRVTMDGDGMRITSTQLTREALEAAPAIEVGDRGIIIGNG